MQGPVDLEQFNNMSLQEKAELLHKVWTEKGFKAPTGEINYSPIYPEQALGYLELFLKDPEAHQAPSYYTAATTLLMLWCMIQVPTATESAVIKSE